MIISNRVKRMWRVRQEGNTLQQVANEFLRTRECIRKNLKKNYGTAAILGLVSLSRAVDIIRKEHKVSCPEEPILLLLCEQKGITPISVGKRQHWFSPSQIEMIAAALMAKRSCKVCGGVVPLGRGSYCSNKCYIESTRYRNRSPEAKAKHSLYVRKWNLAHPERAREIERKARSKYRGKGRKAHPDNIGTIKTGTLEAGGYIDDGGSSNTPCFEG